MAPPPSRNDEHVGPFDLWRCRGLSHVVVGRVLERRYMSRVPEGCLDHVRQGRLDWIDR